MIKAIIFDLGGVILPEKIESVSRRVADKLGFDWEIVPELRDKHNAAMVRGQANFEVFINEIRDKAKLLESLQEVLGVWEKAYLEVLKVNKPLMGAIKKLKKKYAVALLSNIYDFSALCNKKRKLFDEFDPCILSCEVGMAKPDKGIFELALKKLSLDAKECVFVDDNEKNLAVAKSLGFNAVKFENNRQLFKDLKALGVVAE